MSSPLIQWAGQNDISQDDRHLRRLSECLPLMALGVFRRRYPAPDTELVQDALGAVRALGESQELLDAARAQFLLEIEAWTRKTHPNIPVDWLPADDVATVIQQCPFLRALGVTVRHLRNALI
jgi:hypothetical protein